ncbi:hypothetical protein [Alkaliflexus imshenetskii]|uniref:hypothetical protein n=1 Tax=Alkaliflexus imshenetskii TaxID=286730 RepID=UPI0012F8DD59|nr:hypothetical protein [Alkaliflexus imshenetskii]
MRKKSTFNDCKARPGSGSENFGQSCEAEASDGSSRAESSIVSVFIITPEKVHSYQL